MTAADDNQELAFLAPEPTVSDAELRGAFETYARARARPGDGSGPAHVAEVALWQRVLQLPAVRTVIDAVDGVPDALGGLARTARAAGEIDTTAPLAEMVTAARALSRCGAPHASHASARVGSGETCATWAERLDESTLLVPASGGVALASLPGRLVLVERSEPAGRRIDNLAGRPLYAWDLAGAAVVATGEKARTIERLAQQEWRLLTACTLLGIMDAGLGLAVHHARERHQFGVPIGSFQSIAHQLATAAIHTEGLRTLLDDILAGRTTTTRPDHDPLAAYLHAVRVAPRVLETCVHVHGGQGVTASAAAARQLRRAKGLTLTGEPRHRLYGELGTGIPELIADEAPSAEGDRAIRDRARGFFREMQAHRPDADGSVLLPAMADAALLGMQWTGAELEFDLTPRQHLAVADEAMQCGFELTALTTTMNVAKTLTVVGSAEQQCDILPAVARGEAIICLGYTEEQAGSDLGAVTTQAVRDGAGWRIDGSKLYTSRAHIARYVFLLTVTDAQAPKWKGLTMFLVPLTTPGITITPLPMLSGTFTTATRYDDVWVPDSMRIGEVDAGGSVMAIALDFEHGGGSVPGRTLAGPGRRLLAAAVEAATTRIGLAAAPVIDDPLARATLIDHLIDNRVSAALEHRSIRRAGAHGTTGPLASIAKVQSREAYQRACGDVLDLFGERAAFARGSDAAIVDGLFEECYRAAQAVTIHGGTSEIQRSIIAERWLGLPRGKRR